MDTLKGIAEDAACDKAVSKVNDYAGKYIKTKNPYTEETPDGGRRRLKLPSNATKAEQKAWKKVKKRAWIDDKCFMGCYPVSCGLGLGPLVVLIPVLGPIMMYAVHARLIQIATSNFDIDEATQVKLHANVLFDLLISLPPVIGSCFEWLNGCSTRNAALVHTYLCEQLVNRKYEMETVDKPPPNRYAVVDGAIVQKQQMTGSSMAPTSGYVLPKSMRSKPPVPIRGREPATIQHKATEPISPTDYGQPHRESSRWGIYNSKSQPAPPLPAPPPGHANIQLKSDAERQIYEKQRRNTTARLHSMRSSVVNNYYVVPSSPDPHDPPAPPPRSPERLSASNNGISNASNGPTPTATPASQSSPAFNSSAQFQSSPAHSDAQWNHYTTTVPTTTDQPQTVHKVPPPYNAYQPSAPVAKLPDLSHLDDLPSESADIFYPSSDPTDTYEKRNSRSGRKPPPA